MKDYIQIGIDRGLISLNEDRSRMEIATHVNEQCQRTKVLQEEDKRILDAAIPEVVRKPEIVNGD